MGSAQVSPRLLDPARSRMPARREVLAFELSSLRGREPRVVEECVDLIRERLVPDCEHRDLWIPVQTGANVRVDIETGHAEIFDLGAESVRNGDHRHELIVWNHL